jgi:glycosyltransferase involved in cell wall biosynthesis
MVSYLYSPLENPGARRSEKFAKFLPEFGYKPLILTSSARGREKSDVANGVFRAGDPVGFAKRLYRLTRFRSVPVAQRPNIAIAPDHPLSRIQARYCVPDPEVTWLPSAVLRGMRVLRSESVDVLYSTSSPETDHLVAWILKSLTGLPWVADFRDGWVFEPLRGARLTVPWRARTELFLEGAVVAAADAIVVVNDVMAQDLNRRYPSAAHKVTTITNGYDPDDLPAPTSRSNNDTFFRIVHTGRVSGSRPHTTIEGLLAALTNLREREHPLLSKLRLYFVGELSGQEITSIERCPVRDCFVVTGPVSYQRALQYQADADALLLVVAPGSTGVSTTKLYEYLATGKPILALSGESPAARIVRESGSGVVVPSDDVGGIADALAVLYEGWTTGGHPIYDSNRVARYTRRDLTRRLANIFDRCLSASAPSST